MARWPWALTSPTISKMSAGVPILSALRPWPDAVAVWKWWFRYLNMFGCPGIHDHKLINHIYIYVCIDTHTHTHHVLTLAALALMQVRGSWTTRDGGCVLQIIQARRVAVLRSHPCHGNAASRNSSPAKEGGSYQWSVHMINGSHQRISTFLYEWIHLNTHM